MPSAQRAYNAVPVAFVDPAAGPGSVTVSDPRLAGSGAQGNAPFCRRKLRRNLGNLPLASTQATAIANAWLSSYSNPTLKIEVELRAVRDANGMPVPLHQVRADANLYVPELAVRGQQLSSGPAPGVNQFWIAETDYREVASGDVRLTLQLDNYADRSASLVALADRGRGATTAARRLPSGAIVGRAAGGLHLDSRAERQRRAGDWDGRQLRAGALEYALEPDIQRDHEHECRLGSARDGGHDDTLRLRDDGVGQWHAGLDR